MIEGATAGAVDAPDTPPAWARVVVIGDGRR
jgi:hypothetical protein